MMPWKFAGACSPRPEADVRRRGGLLGVLPELAEGGVKVVRMEILAKSDDGGPIP